MAYDAIVVGARVAGAATAMLMARQGLRVLAVDRVAFPSDTISSHQVQVPGIALLHRWGLLDAVRASGAPPTRTIRFDTGQVVLEGRFPAHEGVDALYSPRRTVLDALLVEAARRAGAEVRERFRVEELVWQAGRVVGIRGRENHTEVVERARLVVGADGKHSMVAKAVGAAAYRVRPVRAFASYTYYAGLEQPANGTGEIYQRSGRASVAFPTNDGLTMVYVAGPTADFDAYRRDVDAGYHAALDACGDLGQRVRAAERAERLRTTPDQPNMFRRPYGPGWALVGDAGVVMDSISAQGITNALRDAERVAAAVVDGGFSARHRDRDRTMRPMYDLTMRLAAFRPRWAERALLSALEGRPAEIDRFLGAFAGIEPADRYFSLRNAVRLIGSRSSRWTLGRSVRTEARHASPARS